MDDFANPKGENSAPCEAMLGQIKALREAAVDSPHAPLLLLHPYRDCNCYLCMAARYLPTTGFHLVLYGEREAPEGGTAQLFQVEQHTVN